MAIKTILVALALEEDSRHIADRAVQLANSHDAQLIGLHVQESIDVDEGSFSPAVDPDAIATSITSENSARLQKLLNGATKPALLKVEVGKPHSAIEAMAASLQADLIVIGPGVAKNLRERVFGSTADRVVRCSPCPVLVVRNAVTGPYQRMLMGVDFSDHSRAVAAFAAILEPSARREFIHAVEVPLAFEQAMLKAGTPQKEIERYRHAKAETARRQILNDFAHDDLAISPRMKIVQGDPANALLALATDAADLVAIGTQGANAVAQLLLGSVAQKVLSGSKSDVLVMSAPRL